MYLRLMFEKDVSNKCPQINNLNKEQKCLYLLMGHDADIMYTVAKFCFLIQNIVKCNGN